MLERALQYWRSIAPRERRLVGLAALVLLLAVFYLGLIEPAWQGRQALQRELPTLRQQYAQMVALGAEARQLAAAVPTGTNRPQALRDSLAQSVRSAGLEPALQKIELNGELIELRFKAVGYAQWLAWMEGALRETRMRVADVSVVREGTSGVVTVRLVLEAPRREAG